MARNPQLRASFFAPASGPAMPKARPVPIGMRRRVFSECRWTCQRCGETVQWLRPRIRYRDDPVGHVDHVFPRARGGQNDRANLTLLCEQCNLSKAAD